MSNHVNVASAGSRGTLMPMSHRLTLRALTTSMVVALIALGVASSAKAADQCPNAVLRAQSNSEELPDCRAYETVTPSFMEGFGFLLFQQNFTDDGDAVSFVSAGTFAGNPLGVAGNQYVAARTATGWTTTAYNPPPDQFDTLAGLGTDGLSPDLQRSVWKLRAPSDVYYNYYVRGHDGGFTRIGQASGPGVNPSIPTSVGISKDLSHVVFAHASAAGSVADAALWEFVGTGNAGLPRTVSTTNDGQLMPSQACFHSMSADGRVIVFSSECNQNEGIPQPLWARVGGSATVRVSGSECTRAPEDTGGACNGLASATYGGAAQDGSRVLFTTSQQLVNGDTDATDDLYACDIPPGAPAPVGIANPCGSLIRVSGSDGAQVENVAAVSDDGSRVYFVAKGMLADNIGTNNRAAVSGDNNLYVWTTDVAHPTGQTRFVAPLTDPALHNAQMTPNGRYLIFGTASALVTSGPGTDTDGVLDVYRYDAQTTDVVRVSAAASGAAGNDPFDAKIDALASSGGLGYPRSATVVSGDGSMVVFETDEALSVRDTNGGPDVYLWHDGQVSLLSGGVGGGSHPWITPSGRDIFFATDEAPSNDFYGDVYDARVGGGFDQRQPVPCSGDVCQGQQSAPPALAGPAGADAPGAGVGDVTPVVSLRSVSVAQRRRLAATGKVTLTVVANAAGTVRATATAALAGKTTTVASAHRSLAGAGSVNVTLTLSQQARARLAARGRLTVRIVVSHSKVALSRSATLHLTKAKARSSKRSSKERS